MRGHLFLRANAQRWQEERAWHVGGATLLQVRVSRADRERLQLVGAGAPDALAAAVAQAADDAAGTVRSALLSRGTWQLVAPGPRERFGMEAGPGWDWMWGGTAAPVQPGEERVGPVTGDGAAAEVRACLARANPDTTADPADPALTWWGYRDEAGVLRGVVGVSVPEEGPVHVSGLGTDTAWRRRGVATAMMAAVTRWALDAGRPFVHYGIWSDNDAARRVYTRLGHVVGHEVENIRLSASPQA